MKQEHLIKTRYLVIAMLVALQAFAGVDESVGKEGTVVLHAIDVDTKEPIPGVVFFKQNIIAEDWFTELGETDERGKLLIQTEPTPGYYYSVWRAPQEYSRAVSRKEAGQEGEDQSSTARALGCKIAGLDDVASNVYPGSVVHHWFQFRKISSKDSDLFPKIKEVPAKEPSRIPVPVQGKCIVNNMPGFVDRPVEFRFVTDKGGKVTPAQLHLAERIFHNGSRVSAAIKEELTLFQKMITQYKGDIDHLSGMTIHIGSQEDHPRRWSIRFDLPNGMPLRDGYSIVFDDVDDWEMVVPDYVQPGFSS